MSHSSDVEALLISFIETEGTRLSCPKTAEHPPHEIPVLAACSNSSSSSSALEVGPAATPWASQKSACEESMEGGETHTADALPGLQPVRALCAESDTQGAAAAAAATPFTRRRRSTRSESGRVSSESASSSSSTASLSAAGKTATGHLDVNGEPPRTSSSPSPPSSSPVVLSLGHPVVEFLASVQLQGYAAHLIEDLGLRTMPALTAAAASEADVMRLLGPYASLQQQSELWRGLRRWEKEEARQAKAAAEEQRRRQLVEAREHRRQQQQQQQRAKKKKGKRKEAPLTLTTGGRSGGLTHQDSRGSGQRLSMALFTQLEKENCFALPSLFNRPPLEANVSAFSSPLQPYAVSSEAVSTTWENRPIDQHQQQQQEGTHTVQSCDTATTSLSCVSLTTSATQLMRELSYRRTRSRNARLRDPRGGAENDVRQGESVAIDVDAEEVEVEEDEDGEPPNEMGLDAVAAQDVANVPPIFSQQSCESHLSSLLCSLQNHHDEENDATTTTTITAAAAAYSEAVHNAHGSGSGSEWTVSVAEVGHASSFSSSNLRQDQQQHGATSTESLSCGSHRGGGGLRNALIASRHVSLGALSAHAEVEQLPPLPLHFSSVPPAKRSETEPLLVSAGAPHSGSSATTTTTCMQRAVVQAAGVVGADAATEASPTAATARLAAARARLEEMLCAALRHYNDEVASVMRQEGLTHAEDESEVCRGPVCAVLQPLCGLSETTGESPAAPADRLVCWASLPPRCQPDADASLSPRPSFDPPTTHHHEVVRTSTQRSTLPPFEVTDDEERAASHPLSLLHSERPTALPTVASLGASGAVATARSTADVVPSTSSSTDVSASTTARPTALPSGHDAPPLPPYDDAVDEAQRTASPCVETGGSELREKEGSRSHSVARLTAGAQLRRRNVLSCEELSCVAAQSPPLLPHSALSGVQEREPLSSGGKASQPCTCEEDAVGGGEGGGENAEDDEEAEEPLWVEKHFDGGETVTAAVGVGSRSACTPSPEPVAASLTTRASREGSGLGGVERCSDSQTWWDSYGIGALDYTQNDMDLPQPASQHAVGGREEVTGRSSQSPRQASPAVKPSHAAWCATTSPPPKLVVEVTSSEEVEDYEGEEALDCIAASREAPPERCRTPFKEHAACQQPPVSPTRRLAEKSSSATSPMNENPIFPPVAAADGVDHRVQPAAWRRMTNEELRALCAEYGLAVRPTPTLALSSARSPSSASSPPPVGEKTHHSPSRAESPEWSSFGLGESGAATSHASPPASRNLFDDSASALFSSHLCEALEADALDSAVRKAKEATASCRTAKRVQRMEREALLEALQLLHVRLRFRHRVAPFHLHRVAHISGLPYKRVRAADLLDEAAVLTREDLQQARQRYKAEEQTEVERCVLAALVAEAAEAVERHAQHAVASPATGESEEHTGDATQLEGPNGSIHNSSSNSGVGSPLSPQMRGANCDAGASSSCYEQLLLREPVNTEAVTVAVQRSFPHVAHTRVQQLLALNEVIPEVVLVAKGQCSLPPPSPGGCSGNAAAAAAPTAASNEPAIASPAAPGAFSPSQDITHTQTPLTLSQEAVRRANTRRYFAQRGYVTRVGTWGRGGRRGGGGAGRRGGH